MRAFSHTDAEGIQASVMKQINQINLLTLIREHAPTSRAVLARLSRLSKPTVSAQVEALLATGLVIETGQGQSGERGGKKPTQLEFNADYGCIVVAEIGPAEIRLALTDLNGTIRATSSLSTEARLGAGRVVAKLEQGIRDLLSQPGQTPNLCLIAVGAPGRVDVERGVVLDAGNVFDWENIPIAEPLNRVFRTSVLVDNIVNLAALGEMTYGAAQGVSDFIFVQHGTGIGCGVVLGGKIHHGSNWAAGEIAHLTLNLQEAGKDWTPRGYLEMQVGADRVAERVRAAQRRDPALNRFQDGGSEIGSLLRAAKEGNAIAREIVADLVLHLGTAIAHIAATYDPSLVVLQGEIFPPLLGELESIAKKAVPWLPRLAVSELGEEAAMRGAIVAARSKAHERIVQQLSEMDAQRQGKRELPGPERGKLFRSNPAAGLWTKPEPVFSGAKNTADPSGIGRVKGVEHDKV